MTLSISKKLILSFLGLTFVVLIATLGLARWSFEHGFLDYVNALEEKRLQLLAISLSRKYQNSGHSWSSMTKEQFDQMLWELSPEKRGDAAPTIPPPPGFMLPPPQFSPSAKTSPNPRPEHPRPGPPGAPPAHPRHGSPTALFDISGQIIVGMPLPQDAINPISIPVLVNGKPVAELKSAPRRHFVSPQETAFSRQQLITSVLIGIASLTLALIVSWLLTKVLLAPIRRMIAGVLQLSNGEYSIRFDESKKDELGQLMGNLDRLAHKLEENRDSRRRWLADISHELRTPITVLTGEIESMKDGIVPIDMQQVLSLDQEVIRIRHLIDDLYELSLSDIGGLRYSFSPFNLQESLSSSVELIKKRANVQGIDVELSDAPELVINGDVQRLEQLFVNILENALAYTDSPGQIKISTTKSGSQVSIKIQDTPPGVIDDDCEKLFDPLFRLEMSRSRRTAGAGLGLAICKNIVSAHQGTITASPSKLGGLCIHIILPIQNES